MKTKQAVKEDLKELYTFYLERRSELLAELQAAPEFEIQSGLVFTWHARVEPLLMFIQVSSGKFRVAGYEGDLTKFFPVGDVYSMDDINDMIKTGRIVVRGLVTLEVDSDSKTLKDNFKVI